MKQSSKKRKTASKRRRLGAIDYGAAIGLGHAVYQPSYQAGRHTLETRIDKQILKRAPGERKKFLKAHKIQARVFKRMPKAWQEKKIAAAIEGARTTVRQGDDYKRALRVLRRGTAGLGIVAVVAALNTLSRGRKL